MFKWYFVPARTVSSVSEKEDLVHSFPFAGCLWPLHKGRPGRAWKFRKSKFVLQTTFLACHKKMESVGTKFYICPGRNILFARPWIFNCYLITCATIVNVYNMHKHLKHSYYIFILSFHKYNHIVINFYYFDSIISKVLASKINLKCL